MYVLVSQSVQSMSFSMFASFSLPVSIIIFP